MRECVKRLYTCAAGGATKEELARRCRATPSMMKKSTMSPRERSEVWDRLQSPRAVEAPPPPKPQLALQPCEGNSRMAAESASTSTRKRGCRRGRPAWSSGGRSEAKEASLASARHDRPGDPMAIARLYSDPGFWSKASAAEPQDDPEIQRLVAEDRHKKAAHANLSPALRQSVSRLYDDRRRLEDTLEEKRKLKEQLEAKELKERSVHGDGPCGDSSVFERLYTNYKLPETLQDNTFYEAPCAGGTRPPPAAKTALASARCPPQSARIPTTSSREAAQPSPKSAPGMGSPRGSPRRLQLRAQPCRPSRGRRRWA
ncbi:unnamed protein product [Prorocentrum cordatum]|uniref:Uncharacterized protein n=1 Tax=Prorocentrum cordatum TaxID=2364126 RepID=A0ABN9UEN9_9DINO|nr:unnamed protein product [Polarella glacialis]